MGKKIDLPQSIQVEISDEFEAIEKLYALLDAGSGGYSLAVNAEKIIRLSSDLSFRSIFTGASILICDGVGLNIYSRMKFQKVNWPEIVVREAAKNRWRCLIIGGDEMTHIRAAQGMFNQYGLDVTCSVNGYSSLEYYHSIIKRHSPDIVFIGLGSPKQELLSQRFLIDFPNVFFVNCGGALEVFSGYKKRAPKFIVESNFEWLYRLIQQPRRFGRYVKLFRIFFIR
jgi:exopolysaccharide biosynthesis WecB/TagA/CpsF family protein